MHRTAIGLLLLTTLGCKGEDKGDTGGIGAQGTDGTIELTMPDLTSVDIDAAFADAIDVAMTVSTGVSWGGHIRSLERRHEGCRISTSEHPNFTDDFGLPDGGGNGLLWYDNCTTPGGLFYRGMQYWDGRGAIDGDPQSSSGQTQQGNRTMAGASTVGDNQETRFQFRGTASDSLSRVIAPDYERWTYSSTVEATVSGTDALDPIASLTPGGWRADSTSTPPAAVSPARGPGRRLPVRAPHPGPLRFARDRHRTVERLVGRTGHALEPRGWIGLRDENAWWIDVVFMPTESDDGTGDVWATPATAPATAVGPSTSAGRADPISTICPTARSSNAPTTCSASGPSRAAEQPLHGPTTGQVPRGTPCAYNRVAYCHGVSLGVRAARGPVSPDAHRGGPDGPRIA